MLLRDGRFMGQGLSTQRHWEGRHVAYSMLARMALTGQPCLVPASCCSRISHASAHVRVFRFYWGI